MPRDALGKLTALSVGLWRVMEPYCLTWHEAFPHGSLGQGRALLRQIHQRGLTDIGADAELDIVQPGTPLAEFYQPSMAALVEPMVSAGVMTADEAARLAAPAR